MRLPCDLVFRCKSVEDLAGEDYITKLWWKVDDIHQEVRSHISIASSCMEKHTSSRLQNVIDVEGDVALQSPGEKLKL